MQEKTAIFASPFFWKNMFSNAWVFLLPILGSITDILILHKFLTKDNYLWWINKSWSLNNFNRFYTFAYTLLTYIQYLNQNKYLKWESKEFGFDIAVIFFKVEDATENGFSNCLKDWCSCRPRLEPVVVS